MLLEVLVSALLFALGCIALLGLQAKELHHSETDEYRAEAIHFANAYIAQMWASPSQASEFKDKFGDGGDSYETFRKSVMNANTGIPGALKPVVEIDNAGNTSVNGLNVMVQIQWVDPSDKSGSVHDVTEVTTIGFPTKEVSASNAGA
jgi:Tfp pilus assembly protein PilV